MINYIIQVILFQALFLAVYDLILKKETFFQWNRAYLIITSTLAYILPLIKSKTVQDNIPQEFMVMLPEIILSPESMIEKHIDRSAVLFTGFHWIFFIGMIVASGLFIYKMFQLMNLIHQNKKEKNKDFSLVLLPDNSSAFSFFRYVFVGKSIAEKQQIINHELVHVKQKHSIDLLIFEIQKILFWFNPFSYLFQNRISEIHEFIADSKSISKDDKSTYFQGLLSHIFQVEKFAFVNSFYKKSIIKKRIIMLGKNKSKEILKLKYVFLIPLLIGMLVYSSCEKNESVIDAKKTNVKRLTLNIFGEYTNKHGTVVKRQEVKTNKEGYFDIYMNEIPEGKIISYDDLSIEEKNAFDERGEIFTRLTIYENKNGNKAVYFNSKSVSKNYDKKDYSNAIEVPFAIIDQIPMFPGCEDSEDEKTCFAEIIQKHIESNFDTSIANTLGLESGKTRVYVQFKIDKTGAIAGIRARAPHKDLEKEAIRVISELPQMQPGVHNGKKVNVKYTLPITLNII